MVRALLDDRKTQTRRIVKNPDYYGCLTGDCPHEKQIECDEAMRKECPYGQPGDRLWVKETYLPWRDKNGPCKVAAYKADGYELEPGEQWTPSIFMPRWASRITLEITAVRVERLQEISDLDAIKEGIEPFSDEMGDEGGDKWKNYAFETAHPKRGIAPTDEGNRILAFGDPTHSYRTLWESINGPGSWTLNPWVWAISFRKLPQ